MRTILAASLLALLAAAVACGEEAWDVGEKREFTGTGSTWPDKHVSLYLPEGRYSVEPSSNLKTDELAYVKFSAGGDWCSLELGAIYWWQFHLCYLGFKF